MTCPGQKCKYFGLEAVCGKCPHGTKAPGPTSETPGQSKFRSVICEADNIKFRSKKERKRYLELKALQHAGEVSYFHRQVAFDLPGNTRYWVDFQVFWKDGRVVYEDVKGRRLTEYIRNKKQVEALFPVRIVEP